MFRIRDRSRLEVAFSLPFNNNCFSQCCLSSINLITSPAGIRLTIKGLLINISLECSWAGYDSNDTERKLGHKNMIYCYLKHLTKQAYFIRVTTAILPIWPKNFERTKQLLNCLRCQGIFAKTNQGHLFSHRSLSRDKYFEKEVLYWNFAPKENFQRIFFDSFMISNKIPFWRNSVNWVLTIQFRRKQILVHYKYQI